MRVLQVTSAYYPELKFGGPPQKIHSLSRGLVERGHQVRVATFHSEHPDWNRQVEMNGVEVQYLPWSGRGAFQVPRGAGQLWRCVSEADVVHGYGLYNLICPLAAHFARMLHKPFLLEPLGMYVPRARSARAKRLYHRAFTRCMARHAGAIVATSPFEERELRPLSRCARLVLRRNGIDTAAFANLKGGEAFRAAHGIESSERLVLFIGRISPIKNLEQLVRAFALATLPEARLLLVGPHSEADYVAHLQGVIKELGVQERVTLTGPLYDEEQRAALSGADLFVLPSLMESFGNAAAEAIAAGVPVLLTESCGIAPLVHGRAGLAVPLGVESLANGLRVLLDDSARRAELTSRLSEVVTDLSWAQPLEQTEALYGDLCLKTSSGSF